MISQAVGKVCGFSEAISPDAQYITVRLQSEPDKLRQAICYIALTGRLDVGDDVLLNTTAQNLNLGTGGYDFVIANLSRPAQVSGQKIRPEMLERYPHLNHAWYGSGAHMPGHIMKGRYTPLQQAVGTLEENEHFANVWDRRLEGFPVLVGQLHSQIAPAAAALHLSGKKHVVYIMSDGAALPLVFSRLVSELHKQNLIYITITFGQAFGGSYETVTLHSALLAAKHILECDAAIVCQGPGNAGTGTKYGFSGIEQAQNLDIVDALGGTPIAIVRMSSADKRERHQGISHHTRTTLELVHARCIVPLPAPPPPIIGEHEIGEREWMAKHDVQFVEGAAAAVELLAEKGITVTTMGRTPAEDSAFFLAAAAAGLVQEAPAPNSGGVGEKEMTNIEETITSSKRIYDGRIINLRVDTVRLPNGSMSQREIVEHRGAVAMVPMLDRDTVILVRQYRRAAAQAMLEIPAGTRDPDEDIELCARRELAEEINYAAGRMVKLFHSYVAPGYSTEVIHTFLALDLTPTEGHTDEDEFLEIVTLPLAEAIAKIRTHEIIDSKSISALLYVERLLPELGL